MSAARGILADVEDAHVIVVDDDDASRLLAIKILRQAGLRSVEGIADSREAALQIRTRRPDLVLLDLHMPHVDGYVVLAELRAGLSSTDLPIIVLSADDTMQASDRALELGASDFVIKPLPRTALIHRVRNMLDMRTAHRSLERRQQWVEASERFSRDLFAGEVSGDPTAALANRVLALSAADHVVILEADRGRPGHPDEIACRPGRPGIRQVGTTTGLTVTLSDAVCAAMVAGEGGLLVPDVAATDDVSIVADTARVGSALLLPARGSEATRAGVVLLRDEGRPAFTASDLESARQFVTRAAMSLEITERRAERRRASELFEVLVSQVDQYAIIRLTPTGHVASWNSGAERLLGRPEPEALGQPFHDVLPVVGADPEAGAAILEEAATSGQARYSCWGRRPDGNRFWAETALTALHEDTDTVIGFAVVTRDLTESRRLEDAREAFFAALSHDLRTPLNAIQGFVEMLPLVDGVERDDFIARVQSNVARLAVLTDRLIDHARLRAGSVKLSPEEVDLRPLVDSCVADLRPLIEGHPLRVRGDGVRVVADAPALGRVLTNLLVNAARYSPDGTPIEVEIANTAASGVLRVSDHGRGIPADDLATIFDEFARGSLAESDGGTGLGLASVRQLVTLQGGEVHLDSEVGRGTTVTVSLPANAVAEPSALSG